eukprot:scaffold342805_cov102-Attheya_sp.AAC.2
MTSFVAQLFEPGGGVALIPFIRFVIGCLLLTCLTAFIAGVARIHMFILSFLSCGLLVSMHFFQIEFERVNNARSSSSQQGAPPSLNPSTTKSAAAKTD